MRRTTLARAALALAGAAALGAGARAGKEGAGAWKPFLPAEAYKELSERSRKTLAVLGKEESDPVMKQMQAEAMILAGATLAAEKGDDAERARLRAAALQLARLAGLKDRQAGPLAADLGKAKVDKADRETPPDWKASMSDLGPVMDLFRNKAKGGEGLHPDLQYHPKVKNQNGSEALLGALAGKKLTDANVAKVSKELTLLGYRTAIVGALTHDYPTPDKGGKEGGAEWKRQALVMRDAAVALAEAAAKKDGEGIHAASKKLEASCTECHRKFRN